MEEREHERERAGDTQRETARQRNRDSENEEDEVANFNILDEESAIKLNRYSSVVLPPSLLLSSSP